MLEMCRPARDIGTWGLGIDGILHGRVGLDLYNEWFGVGTGGGCRCVLLGALRTEVSIYYAVLGTEDRKISEWRREIRRQSGYILVPVSFEGLWFDYSLGTISPCIPVDAIDRATP
jgi:hypothetical protein